MITEHKKLLDKIQSAKKDAEALFNAGQKIGGIVLALRKAETETVTRIRYFEKNGEVKAAAKAPETTPPAPPTESVPAPARPARGNRQS